MFVMSIFMLVNTDQAGCVWTNGCFPVHAINGATSLERPLYSFFFFLEALSVRSSVVCRSVRWSVRNPLELNSAKRALMTRNCVCLLFRGEVRVEVEVMGGDGDCTPLPTRPQR